MNTQTKTALFLFSNFIGIIILFGGSIYFSISNYSHDDFYKLLEIRTTVAARSKLESSFNQEKTNDLSAELFDKLSDVHDYTFKIIPNKSYLEEAKKLNLPVNFFNEIIKNNEAEYSNKNTFFKGIKYTTNNEHYIVIASAHNYFQEHQSDYLIKSITLASFIAILLSILSSLYSSKLFFKPLEKITNEVKKISSQNLHLRLQTKNKNDELNKLTATFNNMLDRIETSFETQNNFISNASHELRTPLTAIIGEADVALSKTRSTQEYIETIKIILDEAEKLDRKTKALLFLAQTGFNGKSQKFEIIRVDQLLWDVTQTLKKIHPESQIFMDMSLFPENPMHLKVLGNEQLLHLAFSNIISNACKYSNYELVIISLGATQTELIIVIKDSGIGIPSSELQYIYDPFFRAKNTSNYEGYGIGLPLARNIIRIHKGELNVSSIEKQGTTVEIKLPLGKITNPNYKIQLNN